MTFEELEKLVRDLECFIYPVNGNDRIQIYFDNGKLPKPLNIIGYKHKKSQIVTVEMKHRNIIPESYFLELTNLICNYWENKED